MKWSDVVAVSTRDQLITVSGNETTTCQIAAEAAPDFESSTCSIAVRHDHNIQEHGESREQDYAGHPSKQHHQVTKREFMSKWSYRHRVAI
jgi:hypothetical protein